MGSVFLFADADSKFKVKFALSQEPKKFSYFHAHLQILRQWLGWHRSHLEQSILHMNG